MLGFWAKFPMELFTEHEATVDSSTVADEVVCSCAESAARQYAARYQWGDGAGDLISWAWGELNKLRNKGTPARAWSRALAYDFVDLLRDATKFRRLEAAPVVCNFGSSENHSYNASVSFGDNGVQFIDTVEARRVAPVSAEQLLAEFECELRQVDRVDREIIRLLAHGLLMREVAEQLGISESRVSQRILRVCANFGGTYIRTTCIPDRATNYSYTETRRAATERLNRLNRERAERRRAERSETISEKPDEPG